MTLDEHVKALHCISTDIAECKKTLKELQTEEKVHKNVIFEELKTNTLRYPTGEIKYKNMIVSLKTQHRQKNLPRVEKKKKICEILEGLNICDPDAICNMIVDEITEWKDLSRLSAKLV